jgi:metal-responsive CopG/Arc/MetJ family transcriptional regulator
MSAKTVKVAISLPKSTLDEIEHLRHKLHLPRSRAILEAVSLWLKKKHEEQLIKQYIEGYKRKPEDPAEREPLFKAGLSSFSKDHW